MERFVVRLSSALLLLPLLLAAPVSYAGMECKLDFKHGVVINPRHLRVMVEHRTVYQINHDEQLIVRGEVIELSPREKHLLKEFSSGIRNHVPQVVDLVEQGLKSATDTIDSVFAGLVGEDSETHRRLKASLDRVKDKIPGRFIHAGENYYIGPRSMEKMDNFIRDDMEEELTNTLQTSVGGILKAVGNLPEVEKKRTMQQEMEAFASRMENFEDELNRNVGQQKESIKAKAQKFCWTLKHLNGLEDELRRSIPELKPYDIIKVQQDY